MYKSLTTKTLVRLTLLSGMLTAISACSGGGSSNSGGNSTDNGDVNSLQIITPKTIYSKSGAAGSGYVVVNNPTAMAVKNIHYTLSNQIGSGSSASVDPASAANCATVAAYSQCNVKVTVAPGAIAGSLGLEVSNSSLLSKLAKAAKAAKATTATPTVGIEQAAYNSLSGADGITLSYYHTVIGGTPYILVSGLVASANAGSFNNVVLVDSNNNPIPNQELIAGASNYKQGATFNILLPVPAGSNATQTIKVQTQQLTNGQTTVVSTASASSTLTTKENIGIAEMLPGAVYLTKSNPEQIITFLNTGDAVAQLQQLVSNNPNVEVIFSPASLGSGSTATATLKLKDKTVAATTGAVTLTYNNGQSETSTSGTVDQNVNPTPSPSPTPTPPAPAPTPVAGLTAVFGPDSNFFKTTAGARVTRQLTLTNTGNTPENNIVLTLPDNFTISNGTDPDTTCTLVEQGANPGTISNTLMPSGANGSCTVTVTYSNNSVVDPAQTDDISITYNYNGTTPAPTPTIAAVSYKVTQSTADLSISPASHDFGSIVNNSSDVSSNVLFTITNSGDIATAGASFSTSITGTNNNMFTSNDTGIPVGERCTGKTSLGAGANCKVNVKFGPTATAVNPASATLNANYIPYSGQSSTAATSSLSGVSVSAASINISAPVGNSFNSGDGSNGNPYKVVEGNTATLTYNFTNNGTQDASNFYVTTSNLPDDWTRTGGTCAEVTGTDLPNTGGNSCTVVFTITAPQSVASDTPNNFNQNVMTEHWTDGANPSGISRPVANDVTYVTEIDTPPVPAILIASTTNWGQIMMGNAYSFTATITGGSSTVTPTVTGITGNTVSPASCALDSAAPATSSCTFIVTPYTGTGNYSFWNPAVEANSTNVNNPAIIYTNSSVNLTVTADNGATINGNASPQPFNSIAGTVAAPYIYLPQTGQTPSTPLDVTSTTGADGNVHAGIPWAYVSGDSTAPSPRFEEVDSGCAIKDNLTGLIWVKDLNTVNGGATLNWNTALSTAAAGTWCGQNAGTWRVPNINELASLSNYSQPNLASWLNTAIVSGGGGFSNLQANHYWSSSSCASQANGAWTGYMPIGGIGSATKSRSDLARLFPVRGQ